MLAVLTGFCLCGAVIADSLVYVTNDFALWKTSVPPCGKPTLLYGHDVIGSLMVPSPDGRYLAAKIIPEGAAIGLFDTQRSGIRRTIRTGDVGLKFLEEWDRAGSVLVAKVGRGMEGLHLGVYSTSADGRRKLVARPAAKGLLAANHARYSPDGRLLAIQGGDWLQIVRVSDGKTGFFRKGFEGGLHQLAWLDDNRLAVSSLEPDSRADRLVLVDVARRSVKPWVHGVSINCMVYSKPRGRLYYVDAQGADALFSIEPGTGRVDLLTLDDMTDIRGLDGVTADGKTMVIHASGPSPQSANGPASSVYGIWAVDLDTGKHTLVAEHAGPAAILP
jgi:hypothetical protein